MRNALRHTGGRAFSQWRPRLSRAVAGYLARAPGTHVLLLILAVTTLVLHGVDAPTATRILRHQSTNLLQMSRDAPRVLVLSAFLLDGGRLVTEAIIFTLVMVPVERWIGTYRWLATFAAGHVGATLATTVGIWLQVRAGAGRPLVYPVDVGVSYGIAAVAAILFFRLPRPFNWAWLAFVGADIGHAVIGTGTFTDWGHLAAFAIGLTLAPLVRPSPSRLDRRRVLVRLGTGLLATAAALLMLFATVPEAGIALAHPGDQVDATVLGRPPDCSDSCRQVMVRYQRGGVEETGLLTLPQPTLTHPGDRLLAVADTRSGRLHPIRSPQRVRPDSLFGAMAAAAGAAGAGLLVAARRAPHQDCQNLDVAVPGN